MLHVRTMRALIAKQAKDIVHNIQVLILFFVFPVIGLVMTKSVGSEMGESQFFISIFGVMHGVFTPIVAASSMMAEEKEKNTLRVLLMSNVTPLEYLLSVGGFVFVCTLTSGLLFPLMGSFGAEQTLKFLLALGTSCILSVLLGLGIGAQARNMMAANSLALPFGMLLAFIPMLAKFNDAVESVAKFTYGHQIALFVEDMNSMTWQGILVIAVNFLILLTVFIVMYRRSRMDG